MSEIDKHGDWTKPAALAIPKEGFFALEQGRFGPIFPKTPACYGFSVIAKVKPGREQAIRDYGRDFQDAVKGDPDVLAPLKLHYLRWVLFDVGSGMLLHVSGHLRHGLRQIYRGRHRAVHQRRGSRQSLSTLKDSRGLEDEHAGIHQVRPRASVPEFSGIRRDPYVTADEVKKALKLKAAFSNMLDLMQ